MIAFGGFWILHRSLLTPPDCKMMSDLSRKKADRQEKRLEDMANETSTASKFLEQFIMKELTAHAELTKPLVASANQASLNSTQDMIIAISAHFEATFARKGNERR